MPSSKKKRKTQRGPKIDYRNIDTDDFEDEIDKYHKEKEKILLDDSDSYDEESDEEEAVFDVQDSDSSDSESDSDEYEQQYFEPALASDDELNDEEDDRSNKKKYDSWGKEKHPFYSHDYYDYESDTELQKEEEKEVLRIQEERNKNLQQEDFMDSSSEEDSDDDDDDDELEGFQDDEEEALKKIQEKLVKDDENVEHITRDVSKLTKKQKLKIIKNESPALLELLKEFKEKISEIREVVKPLITKVKNNKLPTDKGISFLEVKYHLLLSYCMNISFYLLLKSEGKQVKDHPVINHLIKLRVLLEKIKPIDNKLKYQIEKLFTLATADEDDIDMESKFSSAKQKLTLKPNLDNLVSETYDEEDKSGGYKISKQNPMYFVEDRLQAKKEKEMKKKRQFARKSLLFDTIRSDISEAPEEVSFNPSNTDNNYRDLLEKQKEKEKREYEEKMFVRLQEASKKDRHREQREKITRNPFDVDIGDFSNISELESFQENLTQYNHSNDDDDDDDEDNLKLLKTKKKNKKKNINTILNDIDNKLSSQSKKYNFGGDNDISYKYKDYDEDDMNPILPENPELLDVPNRKKKSKKRSRQEIDQELLEDDEYYKLIQKSKKRKKNKKKSDLKDKLYKEYRDDVIDDEDKRGISWEIKKNKGLTPHRKKEFRNPRKRMRSKYEKKEKRLKNFRQLVKEQDGSYKGESTGIRSHLVKSRKLN